MYVNEVETATQILGEVIKNTFQYLNKNGLLYGVTLNYNADEEAFELKILLNITDYDEALRLWDELVSEAFRNIPLEKVKHTPIYIVVDTVTVAEGG